VPPVVEMELVGVRVELPTNAPIVLLRELEGSHRTLPIFIGGPEATAIAFALEGVETPRPMTHDLLKNILDDLGWMLDKVVVTELRESTFYAELHLLGGNGETKVVSSRPSDAIALAARTGTTIFADESVLEEAAYPPEEQSEEEQDEVVEQFKEFIDSVNPEDFAS
jgi:bifunctional DNase/RNase